MFIMVPAGTMITIWSLTLLLCSGAARDPSTIVSQVYFQLLPKHYFHCLLSGGSQPKHVIPSRFIAALYGC